MLSANPKELARRSFAHLIDNVRLPEGDEPSEVQRSAARKLFHQYLADGCPLTVHENDPVQSLAFQYVLNWNRDLDWDVAQDYAEELSQEAYERLLEWESGDGSEWDAIIAESDRIFFEMLTASRHTAEISGSHATGH